MAQAFACAIFIWLLGNWCVLEVRTPRTIGLGAGAEDIVAECGDADDRDEDAPGGEEQPSESEQVRIAK